MESFLKHDIKNLNFDEDKPVIRTETQRFIFDKVICLWRFFKKFTKDLYENIPLDTEGYHIHYKGYQHLISRPVVFQIEALE